MEGFDAFCVKGLGCVGAERWKMCSTGWKLRLDWYASEGHITVESDARAIDVERFVAAMDESPEAARALDAYRAHRQACPKCGGQRS